jgi:hypothetical protein
LGMLNTETANSGARFSLLGFPQAPHSISRVSSYSLPSAFLEKGRIHDYIADMSTNFT